MTKSGALDQNDSCHILDAIGKSREAKWYRIGGGEAGKGVGKNEER